MLGQIYGTTYTASNAVNNIHAITFVGTVVGQLVFGYTRYDFYNSQTFLSLADETNFKVISGRARIVCWCRPSSSLYLPLWALAHMVSACKEPSPHLQHIDSWSVLVLEENTQLVRLLALKQQVS